MLRWLFFLILLPGLLELILLNIGIVIYSITKIKPVYQPLLTALLIPAHNEEKLISKTLKSVDRLEDRVKTFVIADRCTDQTAKIASELGATVIKNETTHGIGKAGALQQGLQFISALPYERVAIIDADTVISSNLIKELQQGEIAQSLHHLEEKDGVWNRLQRIKFRAACSVRPKARVALGFSAGILGNGFAFTRKLEQMIPFELNSITEDLEYHLKVVLKHKKVHLADQAYVISEIPPTRKASSTQATRWEMGRFQTAKKFVPSLIKSCLKGNYLAFEPLLDLLLLPLSYYCPLVILAYFLNVPLAGFMILMLALHLLFTLIEMKASTKDLLAFLCAPFFIVWKLGVLIKVFTQKKLNWTPTQR